MKRFLCLSVPILFVATLASGQPSPPAAKEIPRKVHYSRDIRPILSNNCFVCHGPAGKPKAGLRLDVREEAVAELGGGGRAIVPGDAKASLLLGRIFSSGKDKMPPANSHKQLKQGEKELLKRWIEQGAEYQPHWALVAAKRPAPPLAKGGLEGWPRNGIDHFILQRMEEEGLKPSPPADRVALLRRVTLDLTGLPPTPAEVDAFLADNSADAYDKAVDRLLASPHYGERMAMHWLDGARYADTNGYQVDTERSMWPWRDWVIDAFNAGMPFDQFTIDQIAGDMLPGATLRQKVATGFNRNHRINEEGGSIAEEFRVEYVVDRVETTATVWLALTMGCARCHDHKYDPISQTDFYRFFAFFNNVPENGIGAGGPFVKGPSREQEAKLQEIAAKIKEVEDRSLAPDAELDKAHAAWEREVCANAPVAWVIPDPVRFESQGGATLTKLPDQSLLATGANPATETYTIVLPADLKSLTGIRVEALPDDSLPARGPGRAQNGNAVLSKVTVSVAAAGGASKAVPLASASADFSQQGFPAAHALLGKPQNGWALHPEFGKPHFAVFQTQAPVSLGAGAQVTVTLEFTYGGSHQFGRVRLALTESANPHGKDSVPPSIRQILTLPADKQTDAQKTELRRYYRLTVAGAGKGLAAELAALRKQQAALQGSGPNVMVMEEINPPRQTYFLKRGQYDQPGDKVAPGIPASLPPLPKDVPANRLALARWMVDASNPLTARVAVNRYWQMLFGTGIVRTTENFGIQAEWPSHPELLDWLATEFVRLKWDTKALLKLMVTSATYRQSAKVTLQLMEKDPENRLLARGPRLRLSAEIIRDQALAASGLLVRKLGGPSVKPYQPPGLWEELAYGPGVNVYRQDKGENLYRRSMYTFWRRSVPPPSMTTFDAPSREVCTVSRSRTNTPLQALALMNDTIFVEASRNLAQRAMLEGGKTTDDRLTYAFRLVLARPPSAAELKVLRAGHERHHADFRTNLESARKLLSVGESPRRPELDAAEMAALTLVAGTIFNLDQTITK